MFLLQILGPVFILAALGVFLNGAAFQKMLTTLDDSSLAFHLSAYAALTIGMVIVLKHNIWESPAEIIISLFGWIALVKGALLILSPGTLIDFSKKYASGFWWSLTPVVYLVLGAYMTWIAYYV